MQGLFRLLIGTYAVVDLCVRLWMGLDWYVDSTLYPQSAVVLSYDTPHKSLFHQYVFQRGSYQFEQLWFVLHMLVAVAFACGVRTNWTAPLLWVATVVLHGRQERMHDGSDKLFADLMLWSVFLPVGDAFRIQFSRRWRLWVDPAAGLHRTVLSWGAAGVVMQFVSLYAGVVVMRYKFGAGWWPSSGDNVYYALTSGFATTRLGNMLPLYPWLTYVLTMGGLVMVAMAPLFVFFTTSRTRSRLLVVVLGVAIQAGIQIMFHLPQFGCISVIAVIPMLPTPTLDAWVGKATVRASSSSGGFGGGEKEDQLPSSSVRCLPDGRRNRHVAGGRTNRWLACFFFVYMHHLFLADNATVLVLSLSSILL